MIKQIGDRGDWNRIERDRSLVEKLNREAEEERRKPKAPKTPKIQDEIPSPDLDLKGFFYVPLEESGIYLAKKRSLNNESWNNAIKEIYEKGIDIEGQRAEMPTPFEFMTGLIYVLDNKNINDLTQQERAEFLDDILALKNVYRGNHLNARFGANVVETATLENGKLKWRKEPLESCLQENCYADIKQINSQGLFTTQSANQSYSQGENAYFWKPIENSVARFDAYSDWAVLYCHWRPDGSYSSLGVRFVVRPKGDSPKKSGGQK